MSRPNATPWVDETGVGDGTPITAVRMENIENAFLAVAVAVPLAIAAGLTYAVAANTQVLWSTAIDIEGEIDVAGVFVEV